MAPAGFRLRVLSRGLEWLGDLRHQGTRPAGSLGPGKTLRPSQHENGDLTAPPWYNGAFSSSTATALLLSLPPRVKQTATAPNNARSPCGPLMSHLVTSQVPASSEGGPGLDRGSDGGRRGRGGAGWGGAGSGSDI